MFFLKVATSVYNGLKLDLCQMVVAQNVKGYVTEKCQKIKRRRRKMIEIYDDFNLWISWINGYNKTVV